MTGAVAALACIDTSAKYLNDHVHAVQVVWARFAVAFVLGFIVYNPWTRPGMLRTLRPGLQIGRSTLLIICTAFNVVALKYLQLDQTVSILFATPLMVALFAGPMLGEWVSLRRWIAIGVGFLGVLVVTRPGLGGIHPAALLSFIGTVLYAIYSIWTRVLSRHNSTETTLFYSNVVGVAVTTIVLPIFWTTPQSALAVLAMISVGAFGALGHFLLIAAHRLAPASVLAPFIYSGPGVDDPAWLPRVRRCAEPVDADRRLHRDRVRPLSAPARAAREDLIPGCALQASQMSHARHSAASWQIGAQASWCRSFSVRTIGVAEWRTKRPMSCTSDRPETTSSSSFRSPLRCIKPGRRRRPTTR